MTLDECKRRHVIATLVECDGNIAQAARRLGVYRSSLQRMIRRWDIDVAAARVRACAPSVT